MQLKRRMALACSTIVAIGTLMGVTSCGAFDGILIWGPKEHEEVYLEAIEEYKASHPDFKEEIRFAAQGDAGANDNVSKDVESAGSIITFPNDQLISLKRMGALSKLTDASATWAYENHVTASVDAGKIGDSIYAYPISADNGFQFIYNKEAFVGTSVWDTANDTLKAGYTFRDLYAALDEKGGIYNNAKVIWPIGSAWYECGVFFATGGDYEVVYDEKGNQQSAKCWFGYTTDNNGAQDYTVGLEAISCMMNSMTNEDGTKNSHFVYTEDSDPAYNDYVDAHVGNGEKAEAEPLVGIVSWNNSKLREAWGDNYRVATLPTLVSDCKLLGGNKQRYTWRSFSGFKLMGVNPFCAYARKAEENIVILHEIAQYLSSKDVSLKRYNATGLGPSNKEAQLNEEVSQDRFLNSLNNQYNLKDGNNNLIGFRVQDSTPSNFWTPIANLGKAVYQAAADGAIGSFNNVTKAKQTLEQLQYDIESSAD